MAAEQELLPPRIAGHFGLLRSQKSMDVIGLEYESEMDDVKIWISAESRALRPENSAPRIRIGDRRACLSPSRSFLPDLVLTDFSDGIHH